MVRSGFCEPQPAALFTHTCMYNDTLTHIETPTPAKGNCWWEACIYQMHQLFEPTDKFSRSYDIVTALDLRYTRVSNLKNMPLYKSIFDEVFGWGLLSGRCLCGSLLSEFLLFALALGLAVYPTPFAAMVRCGSLNLTQLFTGRLTMNFLTERSWFIQKRNVSQLLQY